MPDNIPPELMALMQGGAQPGSAGAVGGAAPNSAPVSSPMSNPQPNEGEKQAAMSQVQMAVDLLEQTLPPFGSETPEGKAILSVLKVLSATFGEKKDKARGLIPSEIMNLVASLPKGAGQGAPAGAPPGMPPGMPPMPGGMPPGAQPPM